jgi:hypothetical protein
MPIQFRKMSLMAVTVMDLLCHAAMAGGPAAELPKLLPDSEEIQAALEAAPAHLRAGAGVYVLKSGGYERVRESRNGFTCIVERSVASSFEPECFDPEGTETVLPVVLYRAELRAKGESLADIEHAVGDAFLSGRFRAPRRIGICYMLSTKNVVLMDRETGSVGPIPPHLMFFVPYLTNADFGATPDFESHFIIADEGTPSALLIVPVGSGQSGHQHH